VTTPISILFTDDDVVVVDKPAGLATVPAPDVPREQCVRSALERQLGMPVWVVHRLDRDTSGVLLFARSAGAHRQMCLAFEARSVRKTYVAFTRGVPEPREGRIDTPLHPARRGKVRRALPGEEGAWPAATRYTVSKRWERNGAELAMVEAQPETGRHHQIRAHLRSIGTPILFDRLYGGPAAGPELLGAPLARLALHASRLVVPGRAETGQARAFEAPLPADLTALVHWLDAEWTVRMTAATSWPG
jgi:RluA family pseudouridine synthase